MRQLTSLHISGLDFTQADMTLLAQLRRLHSLALRDCSIVDYGLCVIAAHLTSEG
jgi:aminoglycoside phosphotransferase